MTKKDKQKIVEMLDDAVNAYFLFRNRDDYPDKPCVRREAATRQSAVFNIADYLHNHGFITWEQCCEYWTKVGILGGIENDGECPFFRCDANKDGVCEYINRGDE